MAEFLLGVEPREVGLTAPAGAAATTNLQLTNSTGLGRLAYKVKTTCNNLFRIEPATGFLEEGETQEVSIHMVPGGGTGVDGHSFLVTYINATPDDQDGRTAWGRATGGEPALALPAVFHPAE